VLDGASEEKSARSHVAWTCALLVFFSAGCSAGMASMACRRADRALQDASVSVAAAQVYELTLARAYLDKAREEASEAHYGVAIELADASQRASQRAGGSNYRSRAEPLASGDRSRAEPLASTRGVAKGRN
jgi:hypothetical protein